jgi:hypothetical protein
VNGVSEEPKRIIVTGTDVPVLPLLARGVCIMSREVPKSESIARGLRGLQDTRKSKLKMSVRERSFIPSEKNVARLQIKMQDAFIMLHFPKMVNIVLSNWEDKLCAPKIRAQLRRHQIFRAPHQR